MSIKQAILGAVGDRFFASASIVAAQYLNPLFRIIELQSDSFKGVEWRPGAKIQINVGEWNVRTYTPLSLDNKTGIMKIVAYLHGKSPGAKWASEVQVGAECKLMGPRESLAAPNPEKPLIIYGDETAIPMAATFKAARGPSRIQYLFEVSEIEHATSAARALGIESGHFVNKAEGKELVFKELAGLLANNESATIVLAGHAQSIQQLRSFLRTQNVEMSRVKVKAYWSDGREGLD